MGHGFHGYLQIFNYQNWWPNPPDILWSLGDHDDDEWDHHDDHHYQQHQWDMKIRGNQSANLGHGASPKFDTLQVKICRTHSAKEKLRHFESQTIEVTLCFT